MEIETFVNFLTFDEVLSSFPISPDKLTHKFSYSVYVWYMKIAIIIKKNNNLCTFRMWWSSGERLVSPLPFNHLIFLISSLWFYLYDLPSITFCLTYLFSFSFSFFFSFFILLSSFLFHSLSVFPSFIPYSFTILFVSFLPSCLVFVITCISKPILLLYS